MKAEIDKIELTFAGINDNGYECYKTKNNRYLAYIDGRFYILNQAPEYGFDGINGEPLNEVSKDLFKIVENYENN